MKTLCIAVWVFITAYATSNIYCVSLPGPKEFQDAHRELNSEQYLNEHETYQARYDVQVRNSLARIWRYNIFIYPVMLVLGVGLLYLVIRQRRVNITKVSN